MDFADKLNKVLKDKGFTNYRIAKDLDISATTIANYRKRKTIPDTDILKKLCQYIGVSIDYLLGEMPLDEFSKKEYDQGDQSKIGGINDSEVKFKCQDCIEKERTIKSLNDYINKLKNDINRLSGENEKKGNVHCG